MTMRHGWTHPYVQRRLTLLTALVVVLGTGVAIAAALRSPAAPAESPSRPLTGLTILVDPGHGGYDGGARARDSGTWEKHVNCFDHRWVPGDWGGSGGAAHTSS